MLLPTHGLCQTHLPSDCSSHMTTRGKARNHPRMLPGQNNPIIDRVPTPQAEPGRGSNAPLLLWYHVYSGTSKTIRKCIIKIVFHVYSIERKNVQLLN